MPVGVGLDDGDHLGAGSAGAQGGQVRADGGVVDLDPGAMRAVRRAHRPGSRRSWAIATGRRPARSRAIVPVAADALRRQHARRTVDGDAAGGGHLRCCAGGQEGSDGPGQHVAAAGRGQRRCGHVGPQDLAIGLGDDGAGALQHHHLAPAGGGRGGRGGTPVVVIGIGDGLAGEARELAGVRREDQRRPEALPPARAFGEGIQPVGVHHGRHRQRRDQLARATVGGGLAAQARADHHRVSWRMPRSSPSASLPAR